MSTCSPLCGVHWQAVSRRAVVVTVEPKIVREDEPLAWIIWPGTSKPMSSVTNTRIWMVGIFQYRTGGVEPAIPVQRSGGKIAEASVYPRSASGPYPGGCSTCQAASLVAGG
jgi:hypothetical protein